MTSVAANARPRARLAQWRHTKKLAGLCTNGAVPKLTSIINGFALALVFIDLSLVFPKLFQKSKLPTSSYLPNFLLTEVGKGR